MKNFKCNKKELIIIFFLLILLILIADTQNRIGHFISPYSVIKESTYSIATQIYVQQTKYYKHKKEFSVNFKNIQNVLNLDYISNHDIREGKDGDYIYGSPYRDFYTLCFRQSCHKGEFHDDNVTKYISKINWNNDDIAYLIANFDEDDDLEIWKLLKSGKTIRINKDIPFYTRKLRLPNGSYWKIKNFTM